MSYKRIIDMFSLWTSRKTTSHIENVVCVFFFFSESLYLFISVYVLFQVFSTMHKWELATREISLWSLTKRNTKKNLFLSWITITSSAEAVVFAAMFDVLKTLSLGTTVLFRLVFPLLLLEDFIFEPSKLSTEAFEIRKYIYLNTYILILIPCFFFETG